MSESADFLVEVGTEELPPRALPALARAFADGIAKGFGEAALGFDGVDHYATPRRLAVLLHGLARRQEDREVISRGPPVRIAFDGDGRPTRAAEAFAAKCGVAVEALERVETAKGEWLTHRSLERGRSAAELAPGIVTAALDALPVPRRMRWGAGEEEFVRPVHWLVMLHGDAVVPATVLGAVSGRATCGHRFHAPGAIELATPASYAERLESEGRVVAAFEDRRERIRAAVTAAATECGGRVVMDEALLEEVTALVEWPVTVTASFEERFLELPPEVLIETLQSHQRYFAIADGDGRLLPRFATVSNIDSRDASAVREGNERVVRPRLSDAAFFWETDRRRTLASRVDALASVVFQNRLGTLHDKSRRVAALATFVAALCDSDAALAERAAMLAKCDLLTDMVGEFPSLQGIMGRYYALHDGEPAEVAAALEEQYRPRYAGDELPATATGRALAIAEKTDTIVSIFAIGQRPTGTRDPFGLRRSTLGVLRTLIETGQDVDLRELITRATLLLPFDVDGQALCETVYDYMMERLRAYYLEGEHAMAGVTSPMFDAVLARRPARPLDFHQRLAAVLEFSRLDAAESLAAANKRIANILRSATDEVPAEAAPDGLSEDAERALHEQLERMRAEVTPLLERRDYRDALVRLAELRPAVDRFFDDVMVMVDEPALRVNRLALLSQMRGLFLRTADLSRLQSG